MEPFVREDDTEDTEKSEDGDVSRIEDADVDADDND
jgi:hypothetical protein